MLEIAESMPVWVVWINTDLTEGRGHELPRHVCALEATARRKAHKAGVQGSNARISKETAYRVSEDGKVLRTWFAPVHLEPPSEEDEAEQEKQDRRNEAIARAKGFGLSDGDIAAIQGLA